MRPLLNTLYVTTQDTYLAKEGESVLVRMEGRTLFRTPVHTLESIVCFGRVGVSPALMGFCGHREVPISLLDENGRFLARIQGPVSGNVLLRREQYRRADSPQSSAEIARSIVLAKTANCRAVILRSLRDRPGVESAGELKSAGDRLKLVLDSLAEPLPLATVRGREGEAAKAYFGVFDHLISGDKSAFAFQGRNRRPPLDRMNALLSFLYTLLVHDIASALEGVGLDPAVGFLHRDRPGRPGLALDMMEEFRPVIADRLALTLVNRRQLKAEGFVETESGAVLMDDETRKEVLIAYQKRKREEITHPFLGEKVPLGLLFHLQARLLARHLRDDLEGYPPFIWR